MKEREREMEKEREKEEWGIVKSNFFVARVGRMGHSNWLPYFIHPMPHFI